MDAIFLSHLSIDELRQRQRQLQINCSQFPQNQQKQQITTYQQYSKIIIINGINYELEKHPSKESFIKGHEYALKDCPKLAEIQLNVALQLRKLLFLEFDLIINDCQYRCTGKHRNLLCYFCKKMLFDSEQDYFNYVSEEVIQLDCQHYFHSECAYKNVQNNSLLCPICQLVYKTPQFDKSLKGCMHYTSIKSTLFDDFPYVIQLQFNFLMKFNEKLTTNQRFTTYLPFSTKGDQIFYLMEGCFKRGILFRLNNKLEPQFPIYNHLTQLLEYNNSKKQYLIKLKAQLDNLLSK